MGHLEGTGMGGRESADVLENVAMLCRFHHDLLDGRTHHGLRRAHGACLRAVIELREEVGSLRRRLERRTDERDGDGGGVEA